MTVEELGQKVKSQYPQYAGFSDRVVGEKTLSIYPQYAQAVDGYALDINKEPPPPPKRGVLQKAEQILGSIFSGRQIGRFIGDIATGGKPKITKELAADVASIPLTFLGGAGIMRQALSAGALGATRSISEGEKPVKSAALSAGIVGALGGVGKLFNLLGKKIAPSTIEFTSGVPREAVRTALTRPEIARVGRTTSSAKEVRDRAASTLGSLYRNLSDEFEDGLGQIRQVTGQTKKGVVYDKGGFLGSAKIISERLNTYAQRYAREFGLSVKNLPEGVAVDFSKSPIVKGGERKNVEMSLETLSNWKDFSARGMEDLARRIGALRNFESGVRTESSAILSKIYSRIAGTGTGKTKGLIQEFYPELHTLRTNYAISRKSLDAINNIIRYDKKQPRQIQQSVNLLSNVFRNDKELYINILKELERRGNIDILGTLAGTEFQRVLPNFIRGLGGAGVATAAFTLLRPEMLLLLPMFSPRGAGKILEVTPKIGKALREMTRVTAPNVIRSFTSDQKEE